MNRFFEDACNRFFFRQRNEQYRHIVLQTPRAQKWKRKIHKRKVIFWEGTVRGGEKACSNVFLFAQLKEGAEPSRVNRARSAAAPSMYAVDMMEMENNFPRMLQPGAHPVELCC